MKNQRIFLFPTLILIPALTFSADLIRVPASSRITAVTVYADRALTTRSSTLTLKPGRDQERWDDHLEDAAAGGRADLRHTGGIPKGEGINGL